MHEKSGSGNNWLVRPAFCCHDLESLHTRNFGWRMFTLLQGKQNAQSTPYRVSRRVSIQATTFYLSICQPIMTDASFLIAAQIRQV